VARATEHFGITSTRLSEMIIEDPLGLTNAVIEPGVSAVQLRISPHRLAETLAREKSERRKRQALQAGRKFTRHAGTPVFIAAQCVVVARRLDHTGHHRGAKFLRFAAGVQIAAATARATREVVLPNGAAHRPQKALS
jgi:thiamine monophosphate synthase